MTSSFIRKSTLKESFFNIFVTLKLLSTNDMFLRQYIILLTFKSKLCCVFNISFENIECPNITIVSSLLNAQTSPTVVDTRSLEIFYSDMNLRIDYEIL